MGWDFRQKEELDKRKLEKWHWVTSKAGTSGQGLTEWNLGSKGRVEGWRMVLDSGLTKVAQALWRVDVNGLGIS